MPLQRPHPPIVVTAVAPFSQGIAEAAGRGWGPISVNFLLPKWFRTHWTKYVEGCEKAGRRPGTANWRVAKSVFFAQDDSTAKAYATGADGPYYYHYWSLVGKLIIHGSPARVTDQLMALQAETGKFGTMLYAGVDWKDRDLARNSVRLMAEKLLPNLP